MKKIIFILILTLGVASCDDFLILAPEYQINEVDFYVSENDYETAIIGIYNYLQSLHSASILFLTELTTDNTMIDWASPADTEVECDNMDITAYNGFVRSIWVYCFRIVAYSNNILERINDIDMDESKRNQIEGEALFLRAYSYFYLVRLFGDVPIVGVAFNSADEIFDFDMTRQSVSNVYAMIEDDLKNSATLLNDIELSKGRASIGAAKTLLGKVYLTEGEYSDAATVLKEVIDSGDYFLVDDYGSMFDGTNEESNESIFEIEYLSGNLGEGNSFSWYFAPALYNAAIFENNLQAAGRIVPTQDMFNAYEEGDLRKNASVADSVLLTDGSYGHHLWGLKFVDFSASPLTDGGINFTALRYADVLLMYAEALNETSQTVEALPYFNIVRERAGLDDLSGLSKDEFTIAMEKERRVEFLYEGQRWFDLIRTGRAQTVLNTHFAELGYSYTVQGYELLMPIPEDEIEISPELEQNPNY